MSAHFSPLPLLSPWSCAPLSPPAASSLCPSPPSPPPVSVPNRQPEGTCDHLSQVTYLPCSEPSCSFISLRVNTEVHLMLASPHRSSLSPLPCFHPSMLKLPWRPSDLPDILLPQRLALTVPFTCNALPADIHRTPSPPSELYSNTLQCGLP